MWENVKESISIVTQIYSLMQLIVASACTVIVLASANEKTKILWKKILKDIGLGAVLLAIMIVLDVVFLLFSQSWLSFLRGSNFAASVIISVTIFSLIFCRYDRKHKLLFTTLTISTVVTVMEIGHPINFLKTSEYGVISEFPNANVIETICNILSIAFAVLIRYMFVLRYELSVKSIVINVAVSIVTIVAVLVHAHQIAVWNIQNVKYGIKIFIAVLFGIIYFVNICIYILTYFLCKEQYSLLELQLEAKKRETDMEMIRLSEINLVELREIRHDIKNQYGYMKSLIESGEYGLLKEYVESFSDTFGRVLYDYIDCGNADINAIINLEKAKAYGYGIKLNTEILVPHELNIHAIDLCGLIGNLVDNALENCSSEKEAEVNVLIRVYNGQFYFRVDNPTNKIQEDLKDNLETSKSDKVNHGYGTKIVKQIVMKYKGFFHYKIVEGRFIAEALLSM